MSANKVLSLFEAIRQNVHDGATVYMAGFTHLIPFAAGHEIIRQGIRNLTLCRATPDLIYDQMIAAGCASKAIFSWAGNPGVGPLRVFRQSVETKQLAIEEYSHFGMVARLTAGAMNMPFMPVLTNLGTDLPRVNPQIRSIECPYTGRTISTVPALNPDVAIIHVQRADAEGNGQVWGIIGEQKEAAFAAKRVVLTCEEIVPTEVIRSDPNRTLIPGFVVDAVVEVRWGAHPSYAQGYYDRDNDFYVEWDRISADPAMLNTWMEEHILSVSSHHEYTVRLGAERLLRLTPRNEYAVPVNYGRYE